MAERTQKQKATPSRDDEVEVEAPPVAASGDRLKAELDDLLAVAGVAVATAADAGPWMIDNCGLMVMTTSGCAVPFLPEVVPQPVRATSVTNADKRSKIEGVMVNCL